jgi:hypothetical protein
MTSIVAGLIDKEKCMTQFEDEVLAILKEILELLKKGERK